MTLDYIVTEEEMNTIFVGLRETVVDFTDMVKIKGSNPLKGLPLSDETKAKISKRIKGIKRTEEQKKHLSITLKGHPVSTETRNKMVKMAAERPLVSCLICRKIFKGNGVFINHHNRKHLGI